MNFATKMFRLKSFLLLLQAWIIIVSFKFSFCLTKYDRKDLENLREEVRQMFQHAYESYLNFAYPYDELRPLSCDGVDTWGSYSLTLIDALDTLAVMGNYTEFQRVVNIVTANANFDANINVSVFETNIRIIGGLLSAHLLSHRAGVSVVPGWPCNGPLLELAEDVARRLIAAFDTPTGMPYGTVNLQHGVPLGETTITCTAGVGTFILELGTLSRLTGDPLFEEVALTALDALHAHRSSLGLVGNHVDVATGRWTAQDAGIGAGVDSYYEYLAKGAILLQRPELMHMFNEGKAAIEKYLKRDDWHLWVSMSKGQVTLPVFQSLEAYWPGVLSLTGDINKGMKSLHNYHQVWKQYGFTPEFYYIPQGEVGTNRESYPLRPELIESVMYLYRATGDPYLIEVGKDILRSIQHSAKTPCGYATIKDVRDHRKEDRMESFFLAETTKYLYLLFDPDNFLHNQGQSGTVVQTPWGECIVGAGGYIFNTEAHPIDPGALHCCSGPRQTDVQDILRGTANKNDLKGIPLSTHQKSKRVLSTKDSFETNQDTLTLSKSAAVTHLQGQLELISKAQIAMYANSMLPAQDNLLGTKVTIESAGSMPADISMGTNLNGYLQNLAAELGAAIDVIELTYNVNNVKSQSAAKGSQIYEPKQQEGLERCETESATSESVSSKDPQDVPVLEDDLQKVRLTSLHEELREKLSMLKKAVSSAHVTGPKQTSGKNSNPFNDVNSVINKLFKDKNFEERLLRVDLEDFLKEVENAVQETQAKHLGDDEVVVQPDDVPQEDKEESDDSKPDSLGYQADDSVLMFGDETDSELEDDCTDDEPIVDDTDSDTVDDLPSCTDTSRTSTTGVCENDGDELDGTAGEQQTYIPPLNSPKTKFDSQVLFERLQTENRYKRNSSWVNDHKILSCPAQPFLQRLSMSGEMFEVI